MARILALGRLLTFNLHEQRVDLMAGYVYTGVDLMARYVQYTLEWPDVMLLGRAHPSPHLKIAPSLPVKAWGGAAHT